MTKLSINALKQLATRCKHPYLSLPLFYFPEMIHFHCYNPWKLVLTLSLIKQLLCNDLVPTPLTDCFGTISTSTKKFFQRDCDAFLYAV